MFENPKFNPINPKIIGGCWFAPYYFIHAGLKFDHNIFIVYSEITITITPDVFEDLGNGYKIYEMKVVNGGGDIFDINFTEIPDTYYLRLILPNIRELHQGDFMQQQHLGGSKIYIVSKNPKEIEIKFKFSWRNYMNYYHHFKYKNLIENKYEYQEEHPFGSLIKEWSYKKFNEKLKH